MIKKAQINTEPTKSELDKIEKWLIEEDRKSNDGFHCNWQTIEKAFNNKKLVAFNIKETPIGFLVWRENEIYVEIDFFEIQLEHRGKGIGKVFFEKISEYFQLKGFLAIKLHCSPRESEKFWKKMEFRKFPDRGYSDSDLTYFKPLIEIQKVSNNILAMNKVELWDVEPHQIKKNLPKWTWEVKVENDKLALPIVHPCNCDWNLRWTKNGEIIREGRVKDFDSNESSICYSPFLYIKELAK
jgi:GNAT superfamily N-acetyltransferase